MSVTGQANLRDLAAHGIDPARLPQHVAIIMDGNGRWAQRGGQIGRASCRERVLTGV